MSRFDPYETLGLRPDATEDEIRDAWRRRSKETHPDREGGSATEFARVTEAAKILRDPYLRAEYDRTGALPPDGATIFGVGSTDHGALIALGAILGGIIIKSDQDPNFVDVMPHVVNTIDVKLGKIAEAIAKSERSLDRARRMRGRFRPPADKPNKLDQMIALMEDEMKDQIERHKSRMEDLRRAKEIVSGYEYDFETMLAIAGASFFHPSADGDRYHVQTFSWQL